MDGASEDDLVTPSGIRIPDHALSWRFTRSGGPGGQHVNTSATRVELVVDLTALEGPPERLARLRERLGEETLRIVVSTERSQLRNREEAVARLGERLERASVSKRRRRPTRPPASAVEARLADKRRRSRRKEERREPPED
jgi:ribosome-associated protein